MASQLNLPSMTIPFGIASNLYYVGVTSTTVNLSVEIQKLGPVWGLKRIRGKGKKKRII